MKLSVIIPAYNRASIIGETLLSLLGQTVPADEIIVVDDGSTDGTGETALAFGPPVRVIRQENGGPAAARNRGFAASKGEYIHFFDSDDVALPNKHEVQLKALKKSGADIAYGPWIKGHMSGGIFRPQQKVIQQKGLPAGNLIKALLTDWSIVPHACMFSRRIVEISGGFPESLIGSEDQMMFLNCLLRGAEVVHSAGTLELYRIGMADKLTETPENEYFRRREWAKFLLLAWETCRRANVPADMWEGFRLRAWQAARDLEHCPGTDASQRRPDLLKGLHMIYGSRAPWEYRLETRKEQIKAGLKWRLTGSRYPASYRCGGLTRAQKSWIQGMGYRLNG